MQGVINYKSSFWEKGKIRKGLIEGRECFIKESRVIELTELNSAASARWH